MSGCFDDWKRNLYFCAIETVYDGFGSMICQPFMAQGFSGVVTILSIILGLPFMLLTPYRPQWFVITIACIGLLISLMLLLFPSLFSPLFENLYPFVEEAINASIFLAVDTGYCLVIFTIVNWPKMFLLRPRIKGSVE